MANYNATQVTNYQAGGSGDNLIADGYVKAVEKIWLDSFTWGLTTSPSTSDTILIGYIPANKKIVGVEVYVPVTFAPTTCAINVGLSTSTGLLISNSTAYIVGAVSTGTQNLCSVRLNNPIGMGYVVTPIYLTLGGASLTAPTIGTITTILRYT